MPILQALLRSAAEYFAYLVSLGCRNEALSGAHFFKISLCSIFAKNIANLVSLDMQTNQRTLAIARVRVDWALTRFTFTSSPCLFP